MAGMCCGGSEIEEVANMSTIVTFKNIPESSYLGVHPTDGRPGEDVFCASRVPSGQHGSHQVFKRTKIQKNQKKNSKHRKGCLGLSVRDVQRALSVGNNYL